MHVWIVNEATLPYLVPFRYQCCFTHTHPDCFVARFPLWEIGIAKSGYA